MPSEGTAADDAVTDPDSAVEPLEAVARRAAEGDESAFRALVRRTHARIFRWALARTGDPDDADDVTQEVLVQLHRKLGTFAGRGSFHGWLFRITANRAAAVTRRRGRRRQVRLADAGQLAMPRRDAPEPAGEVAELVRRFLHDLPPRQREVFDLVDLQGLSCVEAAAWLDVAPPTARVNLMYARRRMRAWILEAQRDAV